MQTEKTTYAKITINDTGETEVRQLDVVKEVRHGQRHSILSVDVSQAIDRIEQESVAQLLRLREALLALHEDDRRGLWKTLSGTICLACGDNLSGGRCRRCHDSAERNDTHAPSGPERFDPDVDGIDSEHYEQPPELSPEEEAVLDGIWDRFGERRPAEQEVDND